jgi:ABC-type dipeptide/oligopeptide/nickel transport system ATPase subunit
MTDREIVEKLEELLARLGIDLVREPGEFSGGLCRIGEENRFILNQALPLSQQIGILCRDLSAVDLSQVYVLPVLREMIRAAARTGPSLHRPL